MTLRRFLSATLSAGLLLTTVAIPQSAEARGGGVGAGGGFGGGGGMRAGGGGWGGAGAGGRSWGGGSYHFQNNNMQRGYEGYHPMYGDGTRNSLGNGSRINANNNFYNRDYNGWNNNWRNGGYWGNRPWTAGWYGGWGGWGWWGASSVGWGLAGLATSAAITGLVDVARPTTALQ